MTREPDELDEMDFAFTGEVWEWRGPAPYYFVTVPDEESAQLKAVSSSVTYGWGMIPVLARIGATEWETSLFPKNGRYVVPLKDKVREPEGIEDGDTVTIELTVAERVTTPPGVTIVPANEASWEDLRPCSARAAIRPGASASGTRCSPGSPGPRFPPRNWPSGSARRPTAVTRSRARRAASSPTSTASPSAGARSSRAPPTRACCARRASRGPAGRRTRPTTASGP